MCKSESLSGYATSQRTGLRSKCSFNTACCLFLETNSHHRSFPSSRPFTLDRDDEPDLLALGCGAWGIAQDLGAPQDGEGLRKGPPFLGCGEHLVTASWRVKTPTSGEDLWLEPRKRGHPNLCHAFWVPCLVRWVAGPARRSTCS